MHPEPHERDPHERDESEPLRTEPWPWILAAGLLSMISISSAFAWMAITHPDPVIVDEQYEAHGQSFEPRLLEAENQE